MKGVPMKWPNRKTQVIGGNTDQTREPPAMTALQRAVWFSVWIVAIGIYWLWPGNFNWLCAGAITVMAWLVPAGRLVLIYLQRDG